MGRCITNETARIPDRQHCKPCLSAHFLSASLVLLALACPAGAQELEPRRWSHLPVDTNYFGIAYGNTSGDIFLDPVLRVEDGTVEVHTGVVSYLRSMGLAGKTARFDIRIPYQQARWQGLLDGVPAEVRRHGLGDVMFRMSVNLLGAPALKGRELRDFQAQHSSSTIVGAALAITVPLGQYLEDKLLNLGANRFVIRPQAGVVHRRGPWSFELTGSVMFFTDNDDFLNGNTRQQDPLYVLQGHVVRSFRHGFWASISSGYDWGGQSSVSGVEKDDRRSEFLYALSAGMPVSDASSVKLSYARGRTRQETGSDTDNILLAYSWKF